MLSYYYIKQRDRLYVYDYETGFYQIFDRINNKWDTPANSFLQTEHDYDTDFVEISEEAAMKISNGVTCEEEFKTFLSLIDPKNWR